MKSHRSGDNQTLGRPAFAGALNVQPETLPVRILTFGPALVAVTEGGDGVVLATQTTGPGIAVEIVETIEAGDSFMSALIDRIAGLFDSGVIVQSLHNGQAFDADLLTEIGNCAVRCAAITVSRTRILPPK